jgi:hypothetical protein
MLRAPRDARRSRPHRNRLRQRARSEVPTPLSRRSPGLEWVDTGSRVITGNSRPTVDPSLHFERQSTLKVTRSPVIRVGRWFASSPVEHLTLKP